MTAAVTPSLTLSGVKSHRLLWPVLAFLLIVSWSSGFIGIRYANEEASIATLLFWRVLLSGLILLPFALYFGPPMKWRSVLKQAQFGVMAVFLYIGGFALAIEQRVPTGLVALIADLLPLMIACLSQPLLGERLTRVQWIGTAIALGGVMLASADAVSIGSAPLWAYGVTVGSMVIFAFATVLFRKGRDAHMPVHQTICIQMLTAAVLFGICAWWQGELAPPLSANFAKGMVWLVLVATFLAYAVYYTSLKLYPAAKVSAAIYLSPPVTMLWAYLAFDEPFTKMMALGLAVTMLGVVMASRG
jgi:drug/metabolite transporter (DMT)-like permease